MAKKSRQRRLVGFDELESAEASSQAPPAPPAEPSPPPEPAPPRPQKRMGHSPGDRLEGRSVYVVDSHSLIFQVFHVMSDMAGPGGQPIGAIFGFTRDILGLLEKKCPDYLFCAFDSPGPTFRHERFPEYKIHRHEMPEDLRPQIPAIRRILEAMGVPVLQLATYEADDILATVARRAEDRGADVYLVTSDKDCRQLISDRVRLLNVRKDEIFDAERLLQAWGVRPDQTVDFQALVGDSVDNVPGVPLIGPKIAGDLLQQFGTLDAVLEHAEEVRGAKRRQNLIEGRETALLSRELVRLVDDVPVDIDFAAAHVGGINVAGAQDLFDEFGFRTFGARVSHLDASEAPKIWDTDYRTIATPEGLDELVADLGGRNSIAFDTETTHRNPRWAEIVGYSIATGPGQACYVPVRAPDGDPCLDPKTVADALRPILENPDIEKTGQNLKYDMVVCRGAGIRLAGVTFDTMVADYLLQAGGRNHGLDDLAKRYLNHTTIKISELIGTGKNQKRMDEVPVATVAEYASEDADVPWRLRDILTHRLDEENLAGLFADVEIPLIDVLAEMEYSGVKVDVARLDELSRDYGGRLADLEGEIHELAGHSFNVASPKQLAVVLFDELKLPVIKKTKTGVSTDAEVLEQLARDHPLPAKVVMYRQYAKLKGTYVDALPELVHPQTGRIHTSLNQVVAATGRLSSADPNLQNIPVRTEEGREIRSAFIAGEDGWQLLCADYSQIELRVLAHFCKDAALFDAFVADQDIHARVAGEVYDVPLSQVTREMRRSAKAINFGIIYGQSAFGLSRALDIEKDEAAAFIDAYFARYPGVEAMMDATLDQCRTQGYVTTILGRKRAIQGVRSVEDREGKARQRNMPERTAINTVIQGSAADLIKLAMNRVYDRLKREKTTARMLLQVHDELIFEAPADEIADLAALVKEEMISVGDLDVPLKVDAKSGPNWLDCEELT